MKKNYNAPSATVTAVSSKDVITLSATVLGIAPEFDFENIFDFTTQISF